MKSREVGYLTTSFMIETLAALKVEIRVHVINKHSETRSIIIYLNEVI